MKLYRHSLLLALALTLLPTLSSGEKIRPMAVVDLPGLPGFQSMIIAGGRIVMAHEGANTVDIFDPVKRRLIAQVNGVKSPRGMAADEAAGRVYIACAGSNSIAVIDSKTWQVKGVIGLKYVPENVLVVEKTNSLLVTYPRDHSVSLVPADAVGQQFAEKSVVDVQGEPAGLVWDSQRNVAYLALEDRSEVLTLDPLNFGRESVSTQQNSANSVAQPVTSSGSNTSQGAIQRRIPLAASQPTALAYEPNSHRLYVAARYAVLAVDADSGAEVSRVAAPAGTNTLWLDAPANTLYAASEDGSVNVINLRGDGIVVRSEFRGDIRGHAFAYDAAKKVMFLGGGRDGKSKLVMLKPIDQAPVESATIRTQ